MASNLKDPSVSSSEMESEEDEEENEHTIFSSDEDEPEDPPPPRSSGKAQLLGRKRGISTNTSSKRRAKKKKMGSDNRRLFSEKDEIVLLQGIVDYKGEKNPFADKRSLYESMKGSLSVDVTLKQFQEKLQTMKKKYTAKEMTTGEEEASVLSPYQEKCVRLSKAIWGVEGIAFESANGKSKKPADVVTSSGKGKDNVEDGSKRRDSEKKSPHVVEKESDWGERN